MTHPDLDPTHQAVAESATKRICDLIARGKVNLAVAITGEVDPPAPSNEIPVEDLRF